MRSLGVCCILLALAIVAPPPALRSGYEGLWSLGTLALLGITAQNVARRLRLPALTGWIVAGLVLGPSLLQAASPQRVPLLRLVGDLAGLWGGLRVALACRWPEGRRPSALPVRRPASAGLGFAGRTVDRENNPFPLDKFAFVINVNLIWSFNMLAQAASAMAQTEPVDDDGSRGAVVNMASAAAVEGQIGPAA